MSTGIRCEGARRGLGTECSGIAPAETGLCTGCCAEAREWGIEIPRYSLRVQFERAWPTMQPFSSGKRDPELEFGD
jgi:hypothetical protein